MNPKFNNYKEEGTDNGYESIQDFFMSWTLRCSPSIFEESMPLVNEYARKIVFLLVMGKIDTYNQYSVDMSEYSNFKITKVTTKRQEKNIDLLVFIYLENGLKYLLNIENKWYSSLKPSQLTKYAHFVNNEYSNDFIIENLLIRCDDCSSKYENEKTECLKNGYKFITIDQIIDLAKIDKPTGNELFDSYWFKE